MYSSLQTLKNYFCIEYFCGRWMLHRNKGWKVDPQHAVNVLTTAVNCNTKLCPCLFFLQVLKQCNQNFKENMQKHQNCVQPLYQTFRRHAKVEIWFNVLYKPEAIFVEKSLYFTRFVSFCYFSAPHFKNPFNTDQNIFILNILLNIFNKLHFKQKFDQNPW